jgi:hypothetical protein
MAFEPLGYHKFTVLKSTQAADLEEELIEVKIKVVESAGGLGRALTAIEDIRVGGANRAQKAFLIGNNYADLPKADPLEAVRQHFPDVESMESLTLLEEFQMPAIQQAGQALFALFSTSRSFQGLARHMFAVEMSKPFLLGPDHGSPIAGHVLRQ